MADFNQLVQHQEFGTKFAQNYMNGKTFEKINVKIVISI